MTPRSQDDPAALISLAEDRLHHYRYHSTRLWKWNGWLAGWTLVVNILIPFGLASLLYIPEIHRNTVTLVLLALSGLALALQQLTSSGKFKERGLQLRVLQNELESTLALYRAGEKTKAELAGTLEAVMRKHNEELTP